MSSFAIHLAFFSRFIAVVFLIMWCVFKVGRKSRTLITVLKTHANTWSELSRGKAVEIEYFVFITTAEKGKGKESGE